MPRAERAQRFLFDPSALLEDPAYQRMGIEARGVYVTLVAAAWRQKHPGRFIGDERVLAQLALCTPVEWERTRAEVSTAFVVDSATGEWVLPLTVSTYQCQQAKVDKWRNDKRRQRKAYGGQRADKQVDSTSRPPVGSGSGSGSGTEISPLVPPVTPLTLPAIGGKSWTPTAEQTVELRQAYPAVPLEPAFARMRAWLAANPTNAKTPRGLPRFANRWLAKDQDRAGTNGHAPAAPTTERFVCRERDCKTAFQRPIGSYDDLCPDCRARYAK